MDRDAVIEILEGYRSGSVSQSQALEKLTCLPFEDMDDIKIDQTYPRDRSSQAFVEYRNRILNQLHFGGNS